MALHAAAWPPSPGSRGATVGIGGIRGYHVIKYLTFLMSSLCSYSIVECLYNENQSVVLHQLSYIPLLYMYCRTARNEASIVAFTTSYPNTHPHMRD